VPRYVLVKAMRICARDERWGGVEQLLELMLKQGHTPTPAALHFRCALSRPLSRPLSSALSSALSNPYMTTATLHFRCVHGDVATAVTAPVLPFSLTRFWSRLLPLFPTHSFTFLPPPPVALPRASAWWP
jgi:pentatricopeptide repeat protein